MAGARIAGSSFSWNPTFAAAPCSAVAAAVIVKSLAQLQPGDPAWDAVDRAAIAIVVLRA